VENEEFSPDNFKLDMDHNRAHAKLFERRMYGGMRHARLLQRSTVLDSTRRQAFPA
jgi:hypothetical protein